MDIFKNVQKWKSLQSLGTLFLPLLSPNSLISLTFWISKSKKWNSRYFHFFRNDDAGFWPILCVFLRFLRFQFSYAANLFCTFFQERHANASGITFWQKWLAGFLRFFGFQAFPKLETDFSHKNLMKKSDGHISERVFFAFRCRMVWGHFWKRCFPTNISAFEKWTFLKMSKNENRHKVLEHFLPTF